MSLKRKREASMSGRIWNVGLPPPEQRQGHIEVLPQAEWEGELLQEQVQEEGLVASWEAHYDGDVLLVQHGAGTSEVTYAELFGRTWVLSYEWVFLYEFTSWTECITSAEPGTLYAKPADDYSDEPERMELVEGWLTKRGWKVYSYEGL